MATLTALSLLAGSAALAAGASIVNSMETAPPEPETTLPPRPSLPPQVPYVPPVPAAAPVASTFYPDAGLAQDSQYSFGALSELRRQEAAAAPAPEQPVNTATAPSLPIEEPVADMAGGAIGRPKWGIISSTVLAPQDTTLGATVSNALGIREDPRLLSNQINLVERELEGVNFNGFVIDRKIADVMGKYKRAREEYAVKFAESENQKLTAADYLKKLNSQGQQNQEGKKALNKIVSDNSKSQAERDEARRKLAELGQPKEVSEDVLKDWRRKYADATAKKIEADDDKTDSERDKNKYFAELTELRTKKEEQEKLVKELTAKRNALLTRYQAVLLQNKKKEPQPVDMQARNDRYAKALTAKNAAEENLRRFYSVTWLPLEGQPSQANYQGQFSSLQTIWRNAKAEVELAQAALTAPAQISTTDAEADFAAFASEVVDITRNAVDRNGKIKDDFKWAPDDQAVIGEDDPRRVRGYPSAVKTLKEYAVKPKLRVAANVYYEIANMDTATLVRNTHRFLDYFKKLKGTIGIRSERERPSSFSGQGDVTNIVLREFVARVLELAANQVRKYPGPAAVNPIDAQAVIYAELRNKTNEFVDKQVFLLTKMFKVIKTARKSIKLSGVEGKNLLELEESVKQLYPIADGVPPMGMCQGIFKPATFEALSTGMFKGKKILEEVLEDPTLKDDFLDAIGFIKVSNFIEAKEYARTPRFRGKNPVSLLKKSAFAEYNRTIQQEAYNNPTAMVYHADSATEITTRLRRLTLDQLLAIDVNGMIFPVLGGGPNISNQDYARQIAALAETPILKFVPGIFLEAGRLADDGSRAISVEPLVNFRNACELDGNVGRGSAETSRILDILDRLASMEISPKEESNPLLTMIKKLEEKKKIDLTRRDQAEPQSSLAQHGFTVGIGNWAIVKVTDEKKLNFVETFLTFRSSKFRSIPYNDTTVYGGKTVNTREIYAKLALAEIEKMPSFESRTDDEKKGFPDDSDWQRLSDDFNLNFVIYKDNKGTGVVDRSAAARPNAPVYNVFKAKNGKYYPIRMNAGPVAAPGLPAGVVGPNFTQFNRGILGGAIDGPVFPVTTFEPEETTGEFLGRTVAQPVRQGLSVAATKVGELGESAKQGLSVAASALAKAVIATGQAASNAAMTVEGAARDLGTLVSELATSAGTVAATKAAKAAEVSARLYSELSTIAGDKARQASEAVGAVGRTVGNVVSANARIAAEKSVKLAQVAAEKAGEAAANARQAAENLASAVMDLPGDVSTAVAQKAREAAESAAAAAAAAARTASELTERVKQLGSELYKVTGLKTAVGYVADKFKREEVIQEDEELNPFVASNRLQPKPIVATPEQPRPVQPRQGKLVDGDLNPFVASNRVQAKPTVKPKQEKGEYLQRSKSPLSSSLPDTPSEDDTAFTVTNPIRPRMSRSEKGSPPEVGSPSGVGLLESPPTPSSSLPLHGLQQFRSSAQKLGLPKKGMTIRNPTGETGGWRRSKPSRYTRRKF